MIKDIEYINKFKEFTKRNWVFILVYTFFLYVVIRQPVGGDDWEMGTWSQGGIIQTLFKMINAWSTFNGRIMHNTAVSFFDFYRGIYIVLFPLVCVGNLYLLSKIFEFKKNVVGYLSMFVMLLSISKGMRAEIFFHMNASIPYNICLLIILTCIYYVVNEKTEKALNLWEKPFLNNITIALLTFIASLWIENLTITLLAFNILWCLNSLLKLKKITSFSIYATIGNLLGTSIILTSIGVSNRINEGTQQAGILETAINNIPAVLSMLVTSQLGLYFIYIIIMLTLLFTKKLRIHNRLVRITYLLFLTLSGFIIALYGFTLVLKNIYIQSASVLNYAIWENFFNLYSSKPIPLLFNILLIASFLIPVYYYKNRSRAVILYLSSIMSVAPMVLYPGSRNMIFTIFILIGLTGYFATELQFKCKDARKAVLIVAIALLFVQMENYIFVLEKSAPITSIRKALIEDYKLRSIQGRLADDECLVLPSYSNDFIYNLNDNYYAESLKKYYNLSPNTAVVFDDGILAKKITYTSNELEYTFKTELYIAAYDLYDTSKYQYTYWITKDGQDFYKSEKSNNSEFSITFTDYGLYIVNCKVEDERSLNSRILTLSLEVQ